MLDLRPSCELCDCDVPPSSDQACICSYECTHCAACVERILQNVCPACGGGFAPRPISPQKNWRTVVGALARLWGWGIILRQLNV